jgi:hypothetical protein
VVLDLRSVSVLGCAYADAGLAILARQQMIILAVVPAGHAARTPPAAMIVAAWSPWRFIRHTHALES